MTDQNNDVKTPYERRYTETSARSLEENMRLYEERSKENKPVGILKNVINEQSCDRRRDEYGQ